MATAMASGEDETASSAPAALCIDLYLLDHIPFHPVYTHQCLDGGEHFRGYRPWTSNNSNNNTIGSLHQRTTTTMTRRQQHQQCHDGPHEGSSLVLVGSSSGGPNHNHNTSSSIMCHASATTQQKKDHQHHQHHRAMIMAVNDNDTAVATTSNAPQRQGVNDHSNAILHHQHHHRDHPHLPAVAPAAGAAIVTHELRIVVHLQPSCCKCTVHVETRPVSLVQDHSGHGDCNHDHHHDDHRCAPPLPLSLPPSRKTGVTTIAQQRPRTQGETITMAGGTCSISTSTVATWREKKNDDNEDLRPIAARTRRRKYHHDHTSTRGNKGHDDYDAYDEKKDDDEIDNSSSSSSSPIAARTRRHHHHRCEPPFLSDRLEAVPPRPSSDGEDDQDEDGVDDKDDDEDDDDDSDRHNSESDYQRSRSSSKSRDDDKISTSNDDDDSSINGSNGDDDDYPYDVPRRNKSHAKKDSDDERMPLLAEGPTRQRRMPIQEIRDRLAKALPRFMEYINHNVSHDHNNNIRRNPRRQRMCKRLKRTAVNDDNDQDDNVDSVNDSGNDDLDFISHPLGTVLLEYTRDGIRYVLSLAPGNEAEPFHKCVQKLALWFIETADEVNVADDREGSWYVAYLYRQHCRSNCENSIMISNGDDANIHQFRHATKLTGIMLTTKQPRRRCALHDSYDSNFCYSFVGYTTLFFFSSPFRKPVAGTVMRICQSLILPPYQRAGHGRRMLHAIYDWAARNDSNNNNHNIVEINVEDPAPAFCALRNRVDYERFLQSQQHRSQVSIGVASLVNRKTRSSRPVAAAGWFDHVSHCRNDHSLCVIADENHNDYYHDDCNHGNDTILMDDVQFFEPLTDSNIKQAQRVAKITTGQVQIVYELHKLQAIRMAQQAAAIHGLRQNQQPKETATPSKGSISPSRHEHTSNLNESDLIESASPFCRLAEWEKRYRLMVKKRLNIQHREELGALRTKTEKQALLATLYEELLLHYQDILEAVH